MAHDDGDHPEFASAPIAQFANVIVVHTKEVVWNFSGSLCKIHASLQLLQGSLSQQFISHHLIGLHYWSFALELSLLLRLDVCQVVDHHPLIR